MAIPALTRTLSTVRSALPLVGERISYVAKTTHPSLVAEQALNIPLSRIALPILALVVMLVQQGKEDAKPNGGNRNSWLQMLANSTIGTLIIKHAGGLFPLFGITSAAYSVGQQKTVLDQMKAAIDTATLLTVGYLGVLFNTAFAVDIQKTEARQLQSLLSQLKQEGAVQKFCDEATNPVAKKLGRRLDRLGKKLGYYLDGLLQTKASPRQLRSVKRLTRYFNFVEQDILKIIGQQLTATERKELSKAGHETLNKLLEFLEHRQNGLTRFSRATAGVACFMIATSVLGTPIANFLKETLGKRFPQLANKPSPLHLFEAPKIAFPGFTASHGAGHGDGHGVDAGSPSIYIPHVGLIQ